MNKQFRIGSLWISFICRMAPHYANQAGWMRTGVSIKLSFSLLRKMGR